MEDMNIDDLIAIAETMRRPPISSVEVADVDDLRRHVQTAPPAQRGAPDLSWTGIPIVVSDQVPPGEAWFKDADGNIVGLVRGL